MQTFRETLSNTKAYLICNVADLRDVVVYLNGMWGGDVWFVGANLDDNNVLKRWALNESTAGTLTTVVPSESGSTPSNEVHLFRGSIAGLTRFGVVLVPNEQHPTIVGSIDVIITAL